MMMSRLRWIGLAGIVAVTVGCASAPKGPILRTPMPEQFNGPPADDPRFSQPISYPKDVLNQEPVKATPPGKLPSQQAGPMGPTGGMGRGMTPGGF